jgi:cell fate (sporulation/competence/biofilm development) regulator YlbF (YheA/YmcA/DUF963 family)
VGKEIKMATTATTISATMVEVTAQLADNLAQSEPFLRYKTAEEKLRADHKALNLLEDLSVLQQNIRQNQYLNAVTEKDILELRKLQNAVATNEIIQEYQTTQEQAILFLIEVNQEISQLIGIDFASLARRSSGCC